MNPKKSLLLIVLLLVAIWAGAQDHRNPTDCIVKAKSEWGAPCDKCESYKDGYKRDHSGTYRVELRNDCADMIEVKVAVQEKNGNWRTFPVKALVGQESMTAFACEGTGKYLYWVRRVNDTEIMLPTDQEILTEYRNR